MTLISIFSFSLAGVFYLLLHTIVTIHILLFKEDTKSAIGWIGLVWLAPIIGTIVYILLGINRIHRKALSLGREKSNIKKGEILPAELTASLSPNALQFLNLGYQVHPQPFVLGNTARAFENGDEAYPEMCRLIRNAKKEVLLQSYIFNNDYAGQEFVRALQQASENGVHSKVLVDGIGLNYSSPTIAEALKEIKNLEFAVFLPSKKPINLPFVNLRNHRKILVVDRQQAIFGGMNISAGNLLRMHPQEPIQDVTFQIAGPVVQQIVNVFEEDWSFTTHQKLSAYLPDTNGPTHHTGAARIVPDGPDSNYGKIAFMFTGALACAQKSVQIITPYFLPEEDMLCALEVAAMRGVRIEILLPQKSNIFGMDRAMRANFMRLLKRNIKIYRTPSPFDHSKILLVDYEWAFIGSANWDVRSLKLNFECNMEFIDKNLAAQLENIFTRKKQKAHLQSADALARQPWHQKLLDNTFKLLTPYY